MTPERAQARAVALSATMAVRDIAAKLTAEGYPVGKSTVGAWVKAARGKGGATAPKIPPSSPRAPRAPKAPSSPDDRDDDEDDDAPLPEDAPLTPAEVAAAPEDFDALMAMAKQVAYFRRLAWKEKDGKAYRWLAPLEVQIRTALAKLRPTPPVDPSSDPTSLEARAAVLARIRKAVEAAKIDASKRAT